MNNDTKAQIEKTFLELLNDKPIGQISIKDLTEAAEINRNTFYYHYKNLPDLTESIVRGFVDDLLLNHPPTYDSIEDCFLAAINFIRDNKQIVYHIYNSSNRAIFERHLWHLCDYTVASFISSFSDDGSEITAEERTILKDFMKYECFGFAIDWINRGMPDDVVPKIHTLSSLIHKNFATS